MCCFFIVIKLLMLKILLAGLTDPITASRYDYGYHPSAEEFDNLLNETGRTWTHSFLKAERDRLLMKPESAERNFKAENRYFVPKFHYENSETIKFNGFSQNPLKNKNLQKPYKQPLQNIGSSLEFSFFSDELPTPLITTTPLKAQTTLASNTTMEILQDIKTVSSTKPDTNSRPLIKPQVLRPPHKYSLNNLYKNNSQASFPIYFTNPATGIVYVITEMGKSQKNITNPNGNIPIFITKEQHERDIKQLKELYKLKCKNLRIDTTTGASIIRLQKPQAPVLLINSTKFSPTFAPPKPLNKPSPVIVKTELIVKDQKPPGGIATRPLRKKKNKLKTKPKDKKKPRPPGHKTSTTTTKPSEGPKIITGTRTLTKNIFKHNENISTQLEKPDFDTIFSGTILPQETKFKAVTVKAKRRVNKRSIGRERTKLEIAGKVKNLENNYSKFMQMPNLTLENSSKTQTKKQREYDLFAKQFDETGKTFREIKKKLFKIPRQLNKKNLSNQKKVTKILHLNHKIAKSPLNNKEHDLQVANFPKTIKDILNTVHTKPTKAATSFQSFTLNTVLDAAIRNKAQESLKTFHRKELKLLKSSRDFQNKKNSLLNSKESPLQDSSNSLRFSLKNYHFMDPKYQHHHINKRSAEKHLQRNNQTLPKFIKKSNEIQINQKNSTANDMKNSKQNLKESNATQLKGHRKTNSTGSERHHGVQQPENGNGTLKNLKKLKRLSKVKTNNSLRTKTEARTSKRGITKTKVKKSRKGNPDTEYYFFDMEENYDDNDDDDESEEEEYEDDGDEQSLNAAVEEEDDADVDYKQQNDIDVYIGESSQAHTLEAGLSAEELNEKVTHISSSSSSSSPQHETENKILKIEKVNLETPLLDYGHQGEIIVKPTSTYIRKRYRRRPPQLKIREDYDDDYEDDDDDNSLASNLGGFFRMIFYPVQMVMSNVIDSFGGKVPDEEPDIPNFNTYSHYTPYHKTLKQHSSDEYDEDYDSSSSESSGSSLSNWFSSWFAFNRRNKKIGSTTVAPVKVKPSETPGSWLPSWLSFGNNDRISTETSSSEDYDEYDKWFASWFGQMKPKARKRRTTTTSTTTQIPHVPILTIVDPMKNPQNWIGILANHIINHTSTSTVNPMKDIWHKVTSTTTENPEIPKRISYDKYQIWRLKPQDDSQTKALEEYKKSEDGIKLQWLKGPSLRGLTDVLVPPKMLVDFQASLTFELIDHEVLIFDVGKAIAYEKSKEDYFITTTQKPKKHHSKNPSAIPAMSWHKYYEYDDIIRYLETMRMRFPHLVDLIHIGRSYEGRSLIVMKIETKEAAAVNSAHYTAHQLNKLRHKKRIGLANAVFIEAGTHGMEWIGPATATWIINELLRIMKKNVTDDQSFIRNTTWYIMPVLNPDGYVYSHEYDRFWKKSRSRHISRPSGILSSAMTWLQKKRTKEKICFGVDLDRNWHYQWGRRGSAKSACNEFYAGPAPFSEPETKALSDFLMDYRTQIKLFVSMQSYGQIISYPYKANTTYDTERLDDLLDVAMVGTDGLRKKGSKARYKIDSSNDLIENRSGCSDAFAAYEAGIPFSYTLQLADNGVHGYLLPSASIESTAKDSFEIISGMLDYI